MSATDELRAELTKRGVEWKAPSSYDGSNRYDTVAGGYWFHEFDGKITIHGLTPAQAIAATLGADDTYTREDVEGAFVSGYSLGLDMFDNSKTDNEKGWNQNERDMEEEMEDLGWVRKDVTALGAETCHLKPWEMERDTGFYDSMECDCGYVADVADWASWHFCPSCGRQNVVMRSE